MFDQPAIEWTDSSWSPTVGCSIVRLDDDTLSLPLRWKKPRRIFVNSMSDLSPAPTHPLAIWWLAQHDYECIDAAYPEGLPNVPIYIREQFDSRRGRPGRGRLWIAGELPQDGIEIWPAEAPFARAANECGGIVIWRKDAKLIASLPGFITDYDLNPLVLP